MAIKTLLLNDTTVDMHHGCQRVVQNMDYLAAQHGMQIVARIPAHTNWLADARCCQLFKTVELVVVNGEGTIHHGKPTAEYLLKAGQVARQHGIPCALVNASWQANPPEFAQLARAFDLISLRDRKSFEELAAHGVPNLRVVADLTLVQAEQVADQGGGLATRSGVGFTDAIAWQNTQALFALRKRMGAQSVPIQYPGPGLKGAAWFLRTYLGKADLADLARLVAKVRIRADQYRRHVRTEAEYRAMLRGFSLVVTARFHTATLCLLTGTPFMAVLPPGHETGSDHHKMAALLTAAGLSAERMVRDLDALSPEQLALLSEWTPQESRQIADYLKKADQDARRLFADMAALAYRGGV